MNAQPIDMNQISDYNQILKQEDTTSVKQIQQNYAQPQQHHQPQQHQQAQQLYNHTGQQYSQPAMYIEPPMVQSNKPQPMYQLANNNYRQDHNTSKTDSFQSDVLCIIVVCFVVFSNSSQELFMKHVPALFKDQKTSIVGSILMSGIVGALYIAYKSVNIGVKL